MHHAAPDIWPAQCSRSGIQCAVRRMVWPRIVHKVMCSLKAPVTHLRTCRCPLGTAGPRRCCPSRPTGARTSTCAGTSCCGRGRSRTTARRMPCTASWPQVRRVVIAWFLTKQQQQQQQPAWWRFQLEAPHPKPVLALRDDMPPDAHHQEPTVAIHLLQGRRRCTSALAACWWTTRRA
jgi:hypothetical protein